MTRHQGRMFITMRGPETQASRGDCPPDGEWLGIRFRLGTFMPRLTHHSGDIRIFEIGSVISDAYEIRAVLGCGGMGQVFDAHDIGLARRIERDQNDVWFARCARTGREKGRDQDSKEKDKKRTPQHR